MVAISATVRRKPAHKKPSGPTPSQTSHKKPAATHRPMKHKEEMMPKFKHNDLRRAASAPVCSASDELSTAISAFACSSAVVGATSKAGTTGHRHGTAGRKVNVLCLHGFSMNGEQMREKCQEWEAHCYDIAAFYYPTAPFPFDGNDMAIAEALGLPAHSNMRRWASTWTPSREFIQNFVDHHVAGAIDVILGFSQGALIGVKVLNESWEHVHMQDFRAAIFIASPKMKAVPNNGDIPTLHLVGANDDIVDVEDSKDLASGFTNPTIVEHHGGHMDFPSEAKRSIRSLLELVAVGTEGRELQGPAAGKISSRRRPGGLRA